MQKSWKNQDLSGDGLQTINVLYTAQKKNTKHAYLLTILFPVGAHHFYLKQSMFALPYIFLSLAFIFLVSSQLTVALIIACIEFVYLIIDLSQMEKRINRYNKMLKMSLSLQTTNNPPEDYRGRYIDNESPVNDYIKSKNQSQNQTPKSKVLSFSEQEKLLKEMAKKKSR